MDIPKIIFVVGPTAVGKTEVGFLLAQKLNAEIISCDAMQVYKEISIVNNKPPARMLAQVRHHLIDLVSVTEEFDVMTFNQKANNAIKAIHTQKKILVIIGGSGLYMNVLLDGLFEGVAKDLSLRKELAAMAEERGNEVLFKRLTQLDPPAAQKIHPHDSKRIIRALEVVMLTGQPISQLQKKREGIWGKFDIKLFALNKNRPDLYHAIDRRVDAMFDQGLIEEISNLKDREWSLTAQRIIGVSEIFGFLQNKYSLEESKELMKRHTRQYAKRQLTWFRKEKRLEWIMIGANDTIEQIMQMIMKRIKN